MVVELVVPDGLGAAAWAITAASDGDDELSPRMTGSSQTPDGVGGSAQADSVRSMTGLSLPLSIELGQRLEIRRLRGAQDHPEVLLDER